MHKIGPTAQVTLEGKLFEVEKSVHHRGSSYEDCEKDCPEGWQIPTYWLLQQLRNSTQIVKFNLLHTREYVKNPDNLSRERGLAAEFKADSEGVILGSYGKPWVSFNGLGVRYVRKISEAKPSS